MLEVREGVGRSSLPPRAGEEDGGGGDGWRREANGACEASAGGGVFQRSDSASPACSGGSETGEGFAGADAGRSVCEEGCGGDRVLLAEGGPAEGGGTEAELECLLTIT